MAGSEAAGSPGTARARRHIDRACSATRRSGCDHGSGRLGELGCEILPECTASVGCPWPMPAHGHNRTLAIVRHGAGFPRPQFGEGAVTLPRGLARQMGPIRCRRKQSEVAHHVQPHAVQLCRGEFQPGASSIDVAATTMRFAATSRNSRSAPAGMGRAIP